MLIVLPFEVAKVLWRKPQLFSDDLRMLGDVAREILRTRLGSPQKKSELLKRIRRHARQRRAQTTSPAAPRGPAECSSSAGL